MKVAEVREQAGLHQLRESWERLLGESASRTIFLTWEWAEAWWRGLRNSRRPADHDGFRR